MTDDIPRRGTLPSRRLLLRVGAAAAAMPFGLGTGAVRAWGPGPGAPFDPGPLCRPAAVGVAAGPLKSIKLAWNAKAICTAAAPVAKETGIFARHGLDVEFVNFGGSTEALLEAIATGKADAGIGMALRWLKPLEQGFQAWRVRGGGPHFVRLGRAVRYQRQDLMSWLNANRLAHTSQGAA